MEAHSKQLHFSLTTSRPDKLAASTLRLLTTMVMQGPATAKEISSWFNFTYKPVDLLANRTDKIQVCVDVKWKRLKLKVFATYSVQNTKQWRTGVILTDIVCC